jgi:hypothetical protein
MDNEEKRGYPAPSGRARGAVPNDSPSPRPSRALWLVVGLCLIVSMLSLALSAVMIYSLFSVRQTTVEGLDAAIEALDSFGAQGFHYDYPLNQVIPVSADIPIKQELSFPVEGTFPINTTVEVPIEAGMLGTFVLEVPIDTSIDVKTSVPIRVDESFHIETTIPVSMTIPVDIQPDDPGLQKLLKGIREWLDQIRESI